MPEHLDGNHHIKTGTYSLDELQHFLATRQADLDDVSINDLLSLQRSDSVELESLGIEVPDNFRKKRLEAVRESQSNELFRPFMELILNSLDYSEEKEGEKPHLTVHVSEVVATDGTSQGWQIIIQDKPAGAGMTSEQLLNNYIELHSSGSATNRKTAQGRWKRGMMGIGSKQKDSLIQDPTFDEILVATSTKKDPQKLAVARIHLAADKTVEQENSQLQITLGGHDLGKEEARRLEAVGLRNSNLHNSINELLKGKHPQIESTPTQPRKVGFQRSGVTQIIRLSHQTCNDIQFTPENFVAYLADRLGAIQDADVDVKVTRQKSSTGQEQGLTITGTTTTFSKALDKSWDRASASKKLTDFSHKQVTEYRVSPEKDEPPTTVIFEKEKISLLLSKKMTNSDQPESLVYLNVLGIRVGDPIVVRATGIPQAVDLTFLEPVETIAEGRTSMGLTADLIRKMRNICNFEGLELGEVSGEKSDSTLLKIQILTALTPVLKLYEKNNPWSSMKDLSLHEGLKISWQKLIREWKQRKDRSSNNFLNFSYESEPKYFVCPQSFLAAAEVKDKNKILGVPDDFFDNEISSFLTSGESAKFLKKISDFEPVFYSCVFQTDEPIWFSPFGVMFVNEKVFPKFGEVELVQVRAILGNREDWGKGHSNFKIAQKDTNVSASWSQGSGGEMKVSVQDQMENYMLSVRELGEIDQKWDGLSLSAKRLAINGFFTAGIDRNKTEYGYALSKEGYIYGTGMDQKDYLTFWFELGEEQLDIYFKVLINIVYGKSVTEVRNGRTYFSDLIQSISRWYKPGLNSHLFYQLENPSFYARAELFQSGEVHEDVLRFFEFVHLQAGEYRGNSHRDLKPKIFALVREFPDQYVDSLTTLSSAEKKKLLDLLTDQVRVTALFDKLGEPDHLGFKQLERLVYEFPHELVYIEQLYNTYTLEIATRALIECGRAEGIVSPRRLVETILPLLDAYQVKLDEQMSVRTTLTDSQGVIRNLYNFKIDYFLKQLKSPGGSASAEKKLTKEELAVWKAVHSTENFTIAPKTEELSLGADTQPIDPALLVWTKLLGLESQILNAAQVSEELAKLNAAIPAQDRKKLLSRKAELLHSPIHHEATPGSSYFELLLNSLQAAERQKISKAPIEVTDFLATRNELNFFGFSVRDHVGMDPREALYKLIVPGVGDGKWGVKFLTLLREVDMIEVRTSIGGKVGTIHIVAERNESQVLTDFSVRYKETENESTPFVGTEVKGYKQIKPEEFIQRAGVFRVRISDFSQTISPERAAITLNGKLVNTAERNYTVTEVSNFGTIEAKSGAKGKVLVSINDGPPLTQFDVDELFSAAGLSGSVIAVGMKQLGFQLNILNCIYPFTRDGSGFEKPAKATQFLAEALKNQRLLEMVQKMLSCGEFPIDTLLPAEIWIDPTFAVQYSHRIWDTSSVLWQSREEVQKLILTLPLFKGEYQTIAQVIAVASNPDTSKETLRILPSWVVAKVARPSVKFKQAEVESYPEFEQAEKEYLEKMIFEARKTHNLPESPGYQIKVGSHVEQIHYDLEARAWYAHPGRYSWSLKLKNQLLKAMAGDKNAQAELWSTAVHEAGHEKQSIDGEGVFSHDDDFYLSVEKAIITGRDQLAQTFGLENSATG